MKLNNYTKTKLKPGMTLIEITVVILVLLTLISVLFIGANIYKKGADRAACILNIRNVQQAVRSHQNLFSKVVSTDTIDFTNDIFTAGKTERYLSAPVCPGAGTYSPSVTIYPTTGTVIYACSLAAAPNLHVPQNISGW